MKCPFNLPNHPHFTVREPQWLRQGQDRCCSFCGSWHPLEFLAFVREVTNNEDPHKRIDINEHHTKFYIIRPGVRKRSQGAIIIYQKHLEQYIEEMEIDPEIVMAQIAKALELSRKKEARALAKIKK